jgi:hypothetical protein
MADGIPRSAPTEASPHPEEMKASFAMRVGQRTVIEGSARITPAGVISAGLSVAANALAFGFVVRAARALPARRRL